MPDTHETGMPEKRGIVHRRELAEYLDYLLFPGCKSWFIDQLIEAIELAAVGDELAWIEVDGIGRQVSDVIRAWELEPFVEAARAGEFAPRGGDRTWRLSAP